MADKEEPNEERMYRVYEEISSKLKDIDRHGDQSPFLNRDYIGKCFSCNEAWITRTKRQNDPVVTCTAYRTVVVPNDIVECNGYNKRGELNIWDLIKSHRIIDLGTPDKVMGFKPDEGTQDNKV